MQFFIKMIEFLDVFNCTGNIVCHMAFQVQRSNEGSMRVCVLN